MSTVQIISVFVPAALLVAALVWCQHLRAAEILRLWAEKEGVKIMSAQERYISAGPFFFARGRGHVVFRITVTDSAGAERTGWLRVGGWLVGVISDKAKVIWDS